jgi:hypothetical protein
MKLTEQETAQARQLAADLGADPADVIAAGGGQDRWLPAGLPGCHRHHGARRAVHLPRRAGRAVGSRGRRMTDMLADQPPPSPGPLARLFPALFPGAIPKEGQVAVDAIGRHTYVWEHGRWLPTWDCKAELQPEPEAGG